ncbi:type II secretion system protein [Vibrio tubiashii]|uniref:MSHA biogenesis protein MshA n=1 Tax=Vibrio tubiashii ATCC 19109 TaxID=1051646 RepID=F9T6T1_9VIBR|nr:type II secretion system protein [Vibrio tubiashii]AIW17495.1 hypothetical protein IX91_25905 [Vibrio tubiashii ATCC 19109]EGU54486.1 hypothetical protein VITU9109_02892 [Vibrio tubiashii ATCC 19109]EIF05991.1 hypothetical protein VT1337_00590 [Vibrio tubiashii NCIMB 1337 = ATCC 19106]
MKYYQNKRKQGGFTLIEMAFVVAIIAILGAAGLYTLPQIFGDTALSNLQQEVTDVSTAAYKAKKNRPNYKNLDMKKLCDDGYLKDKYCEGTPGVGVNSFGGDVIFTPHPTNFALRNIKVTIPNDLSRINEIADTLAPQSRNKCTSASGCTTLTIAGNAITITM